MIETLLSSHEARRNAVDWADAQVAAARDDPAARLALMERLFHGPTGRAPRHLPFRRAALSFMRWQAQRGLLNPLDASPPGSVWWRAVNERLLRDGCGSDRAGWRAPWRSVVARRSAVAAVRCHPDTVMLVPRSQRQHRRRLLGARSASRRGERSRALLHERRAGARPLRARPRRGAAPRARAIRSAWPPPRRSPARDGGRVPLAPPRDPGPLPAHRDVEWYIADEQRLGRLLDYAVIAPRLQRLYEWSAEELGEPRLLGLVRDGSPIYAWPYEQRHVWRARHLPFPGRVLERLTRVR